MICSKGYVSHILNGHGKIHPTKNDGGKGGTNPFGWQSHDIPAGQGGTDHSVNEARRDRHIDHRALD